MSGVIDTDGTQWERCNGCGEFVNMDDLRYEQPSEKFKYGRDLCIKCITETSIAVKKSYLTDKGLRAMLL